MYTNEQKQKINEAVFAKIERLQISQSNAAGRVGVSKPILTYLKNQEYEKISDVIFSALSDWADMKRHGWVEVDIQSRVEMQQLLSDAQEFAEVHAIISPEGTGKSGSIEAYASSNPSVFKVHCAGHMNKRGFLSSCLLAMGIEATGGSIASMISAIVNHCRKQNEPLIVLDEFDKVSDEIVLFFITFYNELEDNCGIVITATEFLRKRVLRGVDMNKKGYREFFSRVGKRFIELSPLTANDIVSICKANGVTEEQPIAKIVSDCENDIRRIKKLIRANQKRQRKQGLEKGAKNA